MTQTEVELGYCSVCGRIAPRHRFEVVEEGVLECRECVERQEEVRLKGNASSTR